MLAWCRLTLISLLVELEVFKAHVTNSFAILCALEAIRIRARITLTVATIAEEKPSFAYVTGAWAL